MCTDKIKRSMNNLSIFLPNIKDILAPVLQTSFSTQIDGKDLSFKETLAANDGCWQSSLCVNAETKEYHTEKDCTYTLISILNQSIIKSKESSMKYDFLFNLTNIQLINIPLEPGVTFMFSGHF